jgi:Flp pilus assembly protein TadB
MERARLSGPPITVTCECGETLKLAYGAEDTCRCGRRYTTDAIPEADYRRIAMTVRRFKYVGYGLAVLFALLMLLVALTSPPMLFVLVPGVLLVWFTYLRPLVRRSYRRRIAAFPSWQLRGER